MPRARKTVSGAPAQPVAAIPGQVYGAGQEQMDLQRAMPSPNLAQTPTAPVAGGGPTPVAQPPAPPTFQDVLARASALSGEAGLLAAPTNRPTEPVTAGLTRGPGPGPAMLGMRIGTPAGDMLRRLSEETGDPYFTRLADRGRA